MKKVVLIPQYVPPILKEYLAQMGYETVDGRGTTEEDIIADIKDTGCEAIVARTAKYTKKIMDAGRNQLKIIARYGVGLDEIDLKAAADAGIWVSYTPLANASTVAEHTIGLIIAAAHNMSYCITEAKKGNFNSRNEMTGHDVIGKTVGILGFGKIGSIVGTICHTGFQMKVMVYDPYLAEDKLPEWAQKAELEMLLKEADFICCHMPLTESTKGMIGAKEIQLMKPSAYLINVARGGVIEEEALIDALRENKIAGAGLDVMEQEPPKPDNPLLLMKNVCFTPHMASFTQECYDRMARHTAQCIDDVLKGNAPSWPANKL